jgi:TolB-like protein
VLGLCYFAIDKFLLAPERIAEREAEVAEQAADEARRGFYGDRSIAVLPFDNMSSDPEQVYFADGVAEEVLNLLARIRELRVISRSSAFSLRGQKLEIPESAEILDVGHILEGSVRKAGNRVRVTVQLIEARTDTHLWSKTYDEGLDDVFRIQDEIAADVAMNLHIALLEPLPRSRCVDPEVKSLTEQAELLSQSRPDGVGGKMYALLSRALEIDPDYVPAIELMTVADFFQRREGIITREDMEERYEWAKNRIIALDPDNAIFDYWQAWDLEVAGKLEDSAALYLRALAKDMTDSEQVRLAGSFARRIGKLDASRRLLEHVVAVDPLCFLCIYDLSRTYIVSGDYERAVMARERYLALGSGGHYLYGMLLILQGMPQEALDYFAQPRGSDAGQDHAIRAMAWHSLGRHDEAEAEFGRLIDTDSSQMPLMAAEAAAWRGDADTAFEWLGKVRIMIVGRRIFMPVFDVLRDDPRWDTYRESINMSAARLDTIEFDPVMPD